MSWVSGHGEGWALYAERLMGGLGYLDEPGAYLGMLVSQQLLAVQVPLDIGVQLELDVLGHRLARGRALERRDRLGNPARPLERDERQPPLRATPMPRHAGAGPFCKLGERRGDGPGRTPWHGPDKPSASRTFTPETQPGRSGP